MLRWHRMLRLKNLNVSGELLVVSGSFAVAEAMADEEQ